MQPSSFKNLNLHDSEILSIQMLRPTEDLLNVEVCLDYILSYENPAETARRLLRFIDCRHVGLVMHSNCAGPDTIRDAIERNESDLKSQVAETWVPDSKKSAETFISRECQHYQIRLNCGGALEILAPAIEFGETDSPPPVDPLPS